MRCRVCDYSLWSLRARSCPECGTAFVPSSYVFRPYAVRFLCPHCDQQYFGTDPSGHLAPRSFRCVGCEQTVSMDEMVLEPMPGHATRAVRRDLFPWFDERMSRLSRWWQTTVSGSCNAVELGRLWPEGASTARAWAYFALTMAVPLLVGLLLTGIVVLLMYATGQRAMATNLATGLGTVQLMGFGGVVIAGSAGVAAWSLVTWLVLRVTGPGAGSVGSVSQVFCYTCGPMLIQAVPCVGCWMLLPLPLLWWTVSGVLFLGQREAVAPWRAVLSVLAFPGLLFLGGVVLYAALLVSGGVGFDARLGPALSSGRGPHAHAALLATALEDYGQSGNGFAPDHPARLLLGSGPLRPHDFIAAQSGRTPADVSVARDGLSLADLESRRRAAPLTAVDLHPLLDRVPDRVVATRFGDYIFTYHGMSFIYDDARLWTLITAPPGPAGSGTDVVVGRRDGSTISFPEAEFEARLQLENVRRATAGLPSLPRDVRGLTPDRPYWTVGGRGP